MERMMGLIVKDSERWQCPLTSAGGLVAENQPCVINNVILTLPPYTCSTFCLNIWGLILSRDSQKVAQEGRISVAGLFQIPGSSRSPSGPNEAASRNIWAQCQMCICLLGMSQRHTKRTHSPETENWSLSYLPKVTQQASSKARTRTQ